MDMKGLIRGLVLSAVLLGFSLPVAAQLGQVAETRETETGAEIRDFYYHVISDGGAEDAARLIKEMELRFNVYNRLFRFDPAALGGPMRVRAIRDKESYDRYVSTRLGKVREGAVYLHYSQRERRELVIHRGSSGEGQLLPHQAFIQFLRAFIPNPPAWIREGFAIYFSTLSFDPVKETLGYEENLAWLDTVKAMGDQIPPLESILLAEKRGFPENFQPLAWSVVSFYLNNGREDTARTLAEICVVLSPEASAEENADAVFRRINLGAGLEEPARDYRAYLESRKTFAELLQNGRDAYAAGDPRTAEMSFLSALNQRPAHYAPYYYLGLLAYEEREFDMAETYYRSALEYGADGALVRFALGLNAASAGKNETAEAYLREAAAFSPERYRDKAEELIRRMEE
jgi:tetratricopeptide (TPR) repeat protein